jgi:hypothetical protein
MLFGIAGGFVRLGDGNNAKNWNYEDTNRTYFDKLFGCGAPDGFGELLDGEGIVFGPIPGELDAIERAPFG